LPRSIRVCGADDKLSIREFWRQLNIKSDFPVSRFPICEVMRKKTVSDCYESHRCQRRNNYTGCRKSWRFKIVRVNQPLDTILSYFPISTYVHDDVILMLPLCYKLQQILLLENCFYFLPYLFIYAKQIRTEAKWVLMNKSKR
jgi:hypothetical protein